MKRWLALFSTTLLLLGLCACTKAPSGQNGEPIVEGEGITGVVNAAKAHIANGNYEEAYRLLNRVNLPEGSVEYTTLTSLRDKLVFVPVTAQVKLGTHDNSTYALFYDDNHRLTRVVEEYIDLDEEIGFVQKTRETMFTHNEQGDCTAVLCGGKTIFSYTYVYDSKGHVVSKVERDNRYNESTRASNYTYSSNGTLLSVYEMTNDADGSFWYDTRYNTDGSIASFESNYDGIKETYEYHTNGYLSQSVTQQSDERVTITYDKEGNRLLQEHTGEGYQYQTTFSYDDYGNLVEVRLTDTATGYSEVWESHQYTYNENGNLLTHIDDSVLDETETYVFTYDDNGNLRTKEYEGTRWVYAYDDNGNCLMIQLYRQGKLDATATFDVFGNMLTYDSDDQSGAWTYRLVYYPNGAPDSVMYGINEVGNQLEIDYLMK